MAEREVFNPATGERFWFSDDTNEPDGRVRTLRYALSPGKAVPEHFHPGHAQIFEVLSGRLQVAIGGRIQVLEAGQRAACAKGEAHTQWNAGPTDVVAIESYDPPLAIEPFFTHMAALGTRGELKPGGAPANILKFATFVADFRDVTELANPFVRTMTGVLGFIGRMIGLSGWYKR